MTVPKAITGCTVLTSVTYRDIQAPMVKWLTHICFGLFASLSVEAAIEPTVVLMLQQAEPKPEGSGSLIKFDAGVPVTGARIPSLSELNKLVSATTGDLELFIDPKGVIDKYQTKITYTVFVNYRKRLLPFNVTAHTYGTFAPQRLPVNFSASLDGKKEESGTIDFPVFALNSSNYLSYAPCSDEHLTVALSGETDICLELKSPLALQDLQIGGQVPIESRHPEYYSGDIRAREASSDPSKIELHLRPRFWSVLGASLADVANSLPTSNGGTQSSADDDLITGMVLYQATFSPIVMYLRMSVPIRFYPGLPRLFLFCVAGVIVGAFLHSVARDRKLLTPKRWRTLVALVVLGVVIEAAGIVLFDQTQTSVKVAGVDLDPSRLLPAFLLGVAVGVAGLKKVMVRFDGVLKP